MERDLVEGIRFAEDLRYFHFLRDQGFVKRSSVYFVDEVYDAHDDPDFINHSLCITPQIAPELDRLLTKAKKRLGISAAVDLYIKRGGEINAYCLKSDDDRFLICLSGPLVEHMTSQQILFVIGHELGHAVYRHFELPVRRIISEYEDPEIEDIEDLMRWSRMAEISADRAGLIACNSLDAAIGSMLVLTTGLSSSALSINLENYGQYAENLIASIDESWVSEDLYNTHPFNPLRVVSLNYFWSFWEKYNRCKDTSSPDISLVDKRIKSIFEKMEGDINLTSKVPEPDRPFKEKKVVIKDVSSQFLFWSAISVASVDGVFSDSETETIMQWLFEADVTVELNRLKLKKDVFEYAESKWNEFLPGVVLTPATNRCSILQKLVLVARSDGFVCESEKKLLTKLSQGLQISPSFYEKILRYL
jgi:tellurite resistance protein